MSFSEIPDGLHELLDHLESDPDTGRLTDKALAAFAEYNEPQKEKLEHTACYLRTLEDEAARLKAEEVRLAKERKALEEKSAQLKALLLPAVQALGGRFNGEIASMRISRTQAVKVLDLDAVPEALKRIKTSVEADKVAIRKLLKSGEAVPGVELEERESVVVSVADAP